MSNSSIWPIDRTLSGATAPGLCGPGSDSNKGVFHIPQSSSITGASPSDGLVSYPGHSLGQFYPSVNPVYVYIYIYIYIYKIQFVNKFCRYTQLCDQTVPFLPIQFCLSQQIQMVLIIAMCHLFTHSEMIKQFYF